MKILIMNPIVGDAYGQERMIRDSTRLLRKAGHKVHFLTQTVRGNIPENDGLKIEPQLWFGHPLRTPIALRKNASRILKHIDAVNPDVVHMMDLFPGHLMTEIAIRYPTIHTCHINSTTCPASVRLANLKDLCDKKSGWQCLIYDKFQHCMYSAKGTLRKIDLVLCHQDKKKSLKYFKKIIAVSQYIRSTLILDGNPEEKVELIYNPVEVPKRNPAQREKNLIVIVARLERYKGIELSIKALKRIENLDWNLVICGEGALRKPISDLILSLGLSNRIQLRGKVNYEETQNLINSARIFLQANVGPEPFGLAVAEASSLGTPAIISNAPAINEIILDGVNGLVVPMQSELELAEAIQLLLKDDKLWQQLSENGPKVISEKFSEEKHLIETDNLYRRVAGEGLEPPTKGL